MTYYIKLPYTGGAPGESGGYPVFARRPRMNPGTEGTAMQRMHREYSYDGPAFHGTVREVSLYENENAQEGLPGRCVRVLFDAAALARAPLFAAQPESGTATMEEAALDLVAARVFAAVSVSRWQDRDAPKREAEPGQGWAHHPGWRIVTPPEITEEHPARGDISNRRAIVPSDGGGIYAFMGFEGGRLVTLASLTGGRPNGPVPESEVARVRADLSRRAGVLSV